MTTARQILLGSGSHAPHGNQSNASKKGCHAAQSIQSKGNGFRVKPGMTVVLGLEEDSGTHALHGYLPLTALQSSMSAALRMDIQQVTARNYTHNTTIIQPDKLIE
jgi:hypothetical protein